MSTRKGGVSPEPFGMNASFSVGDTTANVTENRRRFLDALGIPSDRLAIPQQCHSATVRNVKTAGVYELCDALMTNVCNVVLSVIVADCAPVFLFDAEKKAVACVHAGWRGTGQQILLKTIRSMQLEFGSNPEDIYAFIGPSAGQCCYEVGEDVSQNFDDEFLSCRNGKTYLDIKRANKEQLRTAGVPISNTEVHRDCTICGQEWYHSYRRDREKSGRMMAIIGLNQ